MKKTLFLLILLSFMGIYSYAQDTIKAKGIDDQKAEKLYNEGINFFDNQKYSDALAKFDEAITIKPQFEKAYFNRGTVKYELKDYNGAIADFDKSIEIEPFE